MFKIIKSAAAIAALFAVAAATPAAAFMAPAPDAIAQPAGAAGSLVTTVSCGGIDCDDVRPRRRSYSYSYSFKSRYASGGRHDRHWRGHDDRREVRRAVRNLIGAIADRRW